MKGKGKPKKLEAKGKADPKGAKLALKGGKAEKK